LFFVVRKVRDLIHFLTVAFEARVIAVILPTVQIFSREFIDDASALSAAQKD
jgi:hypothetical protein